jgi:ABC-type branched-subunit amino acid transport system ATPase component
MSGNEPFARVSEDPLKPLLQAQGLELAYGEVPVCRDLSLEVAEGEIVTLVGANGAG